MVFHCAHSASKNVLLAFILLITCSTALNAVNPNIMLTNNLLPKLCLLNSRQACFAAVGFCLGSVVCNVASDYFLSLGSFADHGRRSTRDRTANDMSDRAKNNVDNSLKKAANYWAIGAVGSKYAAYTSGLLACYFVFNYRAMRT